MPFKMGTYKIRKRASRGLAALLFAQLLRTPMGMAADENTAFTELLNQKERPTIAQVAAAPIDTSYPYPAMSDNRGQLEFEKWNDVLVNNAPRFIATLEKTFPGATWAFIGRDAAAIADVVEAFYLSIGQKDRVARIGVSEKSFQVVNDETLLRLLKESGFTLDNFNQRHPYILVDTVSHRFGSQGRRIMQAIYNSYAQLGRNVSDLVDKFNMVGLVVSTFVAAKNVPNPIENKEVYYAKERSTYQSASGNRFRGSKHVVVTYDDQGTHFSESGYDHYTSNWHKSFGPISEDEGVTRSELGAPTGEVAHRAILKFQKDVIAKVGKPEFLEKVKAEAAKLDYAFPLRRPEAITTETTVFEDVVSPETSQYVTKLKENGAVGRTAKHKDKNQDKLDAIMEFAMKNGINFSTTSLPMSVSLQLKLKFPQYSGSAHKGVGRVTSMILSWLHAQTGGGAADRDDGRGYGATVKLLASLPKLLQLGLINERDAQILVWRAFYFNRVNADTVTVLKELRDEIPAIGQILSADRELSFTPYADFIKANFSRSSYIDEFNAVKTNVKAFSKVLNSPKACALLLDI